jgi:hypothetical protein
LGLAIACILPVSIQLMKGLPLVTQIGDSGSSCHKVCYVLNSIIQQIN